MEIEGLVSVQSVPTASERVLEMALCRVDVAGRCRRIEDTQQRELEAGWVQATQFDVPAMAVGRVGGPPLTDTLGAVGLSDVVPSVSGVGDEVDACY